MDTLLLLFGVTIKLSLKSLRFCLSYCQSTDIHSYIQCNVSIDNLQVMMSSELDWILEKIHLICLVSNPWPDLDIKCDGIV